MAIDYITTNSGVFYRIGRIAYAVNTHGTTAATTLPAELKNIVDPYEAVDYTAQIVGIYGTYANLQAAEVGTRQTLADYSTATLLDRDTVLEQLGVEADITQVLVALIRQMGIDSQTVRKCVVTLGTVTAAAGNIGNGTVLLTTTLDGFNPPIVGAPVSLNYNGLLSQLAVTSETMAFACTADSYRDGTTAGGESFSWSGGLATQLLDWQTEGSGVGPSLTVAGTAGLVTDGSFENWQNTNTPINWTIDNGTAGTTILRSSAEFYRGVYALAIVGNGSAATIGVGQAISPSTLQGRRMYNVSFRLKASATAASGAFNCQFTGTGYTAASTEKVDIAGGSLPTTWTLYNFFISLPANLPSDWRLVIRATGTLTAARTIWVDSVCLAPVTYHGGVGAVVVPGSAPFVAGDQLSATVANDNASAWQTYFRRAYSVQLPSATNPAQTILDSLIA